MSIDDKKRKTYGDSRAAGKNKHSKVTRIRLPENCSDDPAVDDFLLESLQEEAEEMEKKIAQDPAIANITAPDDMFASIVRRLKAEGIWDESDTLSAEVKADTPKDTANAAAEGKRADITAAAAEGKKADTVNAAVEGGAETAVSEPAAEERTEGCAAKYTADTPVQDAEVFGQTPLQDTQNRTPNRERKGRKRFGILKGIAGVAAIFVLVFGLSMTSGANRRLFVQMWDAVTDNFNVRIVTNYVGEDDYIRSVSSEESDAWKEIQDKTGIPAIELLYVPDGMEYLRYELLNDNTEAVIQYSYNEFLLTIYTANVNNEKTAYYILDDEAVFEETIFTQQGIEVNIWRLAEEGIEQTYAAEVRNGEYRYMISGCIPLEELKKIADYVLLFESA